jgi:hypothetical protein
MDGGGIREATWLGNGERDGAGDIGDMARTREG